MDLDAFIANLTSRKLIQWGLAYVAGAWVLTQVFALIGDQFDWARDTQRIITLALALGALPALVVAWFHGERGAQRVSGSEVMALLASLVLALGLGWTVVRNYPADISVPRSAEAPATFDKLRVAVLPLENLGGVAANAAFVGGFHDTLITQLSRVPGLSVISRTSVMAWEGKRGSVREAARALEVGTVLEGSVQRDGDRVRINVQLVDATTDTHLWAEVYDRTVADSFAVQSEIANVIAGQLRLVLSAGQKQVLDTPPTSDPRAYEQLMLARAMIASQKPLEAIPALEAAVALDPKSPVLFAELANARNQCCFTADTGFEKRRAAGKDALDRALALDAQRPEVQLALATYLYWREQDNAGAVRVALPALAALPNETNGRAMTGFLLRRMGRWQEADELFSRAVELDPRNRGALSGLHACAIALRNRDELARVHRLWISIEPDREARYFGEAEASLAFDGDVRPMVAAIAGLPPELRDRDWATTAAVDIALRTGDYRTAHDLLLKYPVTDPDFPGSYEESLGLALRGIGDTAGAKRSFVLALQLARDDMNTEDPANSRNYAPSLALVGSRKALLGDAEGALADVRRADQLLPFEQDAADGAMVLTLYAVTAAALRRDDEAIAAIERLLARPSQIAYGELWASSEFASLRHNDRFRALFAGAGVDISNEPHAAVRTPAEKRE